MSEYYEVISGIWQHASAYKRECIKKEVCGGCLQPRVQTEDSTPKNSIEGVVVNVGSI